MALFQMRRLEPLKTPLDYPKCLDRIVEAAVNRAEYEIGMNQFFYLYGKTVPYPSSINIIDGDSYTPPSGSLDMLLAFR